MRFFLIVFHKMHLTSSWNSAKKVLLLHLLFSRLVLNRDRYPVIFHLIEQCYENQLENYWVADTEAMSFWIKLCENDISEWSFSLVCSCHFTWKHFNGYAINHYKSKLGYKYDVFMHVSIHVMIIIMWFLQNTNYL